MSKTVLYMTRADANRLANSGVFPLSLKRAQLFVENN